MGCGQKAAAEDYEEYEDALVKVGLKNDKIYGHNSPYHVQSVIEICARAGKTRNETIHAIHAEIAAVAGRKAAEEEIKERDTLAALKNKY